MPVLHLLAGPNGSGKTTFYEQVLGPVTGLPFVNADLIARARWPGVEVERAYEAARLAAAQRRTLIGQRRSFIAETVFSHPSKLELLQQAQQVGYRVSVHAIEVPLALSIRRVLARVNHGGHDVPLAKQQERFARLWPLLAAALRQADEGVAYDNSRAGSAYRVSARFESGRPIGAAQWPHWSALALLLQPE